MSLECRHTSTHPNDREEMSSEEAIRSIRIKTGSLRRLFKERAMYASEVESGKKIVAAMRANAEAGLKQQVGTRDVVMMYVESCLCVYFCIG